MEFEKLFIDSKGKPIVYNGKKLVISDKVELVANKTIIKLTFISSDSKWNQGVILKTKGKFEINEQIISNKIILWNHTAPRVTSLIVHSKDKWLIAYNVWETENGTIHYWHNGAAMYIEEMSQNRTYYCNDGYPDEDFNDLIFKIEW